MNVPSSTQTERRIEEIQENIRCLETVEQSPCVNDSAGMNIQRPSGFTSNRRRLYGNRYDHRKHNRYVIRVLLYKRVDLTHVDDLVKL